MSDEVVVAIVTGVVGVVLVVLQGRSSVRLKRLELDTKATREQVVNGHETNMREEQDERHDENRTLLEEIRTDLRAVRSSVARLWERSDVHTDQIHDLELSQPARSRFEPPAAPRHRRS